MGAVVCRNCGKKDLVHGYVSRQLCNACYLRASRHNGDPNGGRKSNNGRTKHPLYRDYIRMWDRVLGRSTGCKENYVDRDIKVCDRWSGPDGFDNFVLDMGDKPSYEKGKGGRTLWTLDRIDNDKGYSPENCRWADAKTQANNTRKNKLYTIEGFTGTFQQCFEKFSIVKKSTAEMRYYKYGWSLVDSFKTPTRK